MIPTTFWANPSIQQRRSCGPLSACSGRSAPGCSGVLAAAAFCVGETWQDEPTVRGYRRILGHLLAGTLVTTLAGCGVLRDDHAVGKTIRYHVEYSGSAQDALSNSALVIDYMTTEGRQEQKNIVLPWTKEVKGAGRGFKPSVKAQFNGFGTIACRIVADGHFIVEQTSTEEPYPVVECAA